MEWTEILLRVTAKGSPSGRFITLEGGEGAGKSTQLTMLAAALRDRGLDVIETREPGGTPGAEAIRSLLLNGDADRWTVEAEALLFAAARADHVAKVIRPALNRGAWVVCDRYVDSNRAYQAGAGPVADDDLIALHRIGSGGLMPDKTLLLSLPMDVAESRASLRDAGKADRFGARGKEFHQRVADAFMHYAEQEPERYSIIDAAQSQDIVHKQIMSELSDIMP